MIIRALLAISLVFSLVMGWKNYVLYESVKLGEDAYETADAVLQMKVHEVDGGPGNVVTGNFNNQFITIRYSYVGESIERLSDRFSPLCSRCDAYQVVRKLGLKPDEMQQNLPLKAYVLKTDPSIAYLTLATEQEQSEQFWRVLLWLGLVPSFILIMFWLQRTPSIDTGR